MDSRKKIAGQDKNKKKMNTDMKIFLSIASVVIIGLIVLLIVILSPKDETMAVANGEEIRQSEFGFYYTQGLTSILQYKDPSVDQETFLNTTYGTGTIKSMLKQQAMSQVIQTRYLLSEAKKEGFDFDSKDIDDRWLSFRYELEQNAQQYQMGIEEFSKSYIGSGTGRVEQIFKDQAKAQAYYYAKAEQVEVDEAKLAEFYESNKAGIDLAGVRHILVKCDETASDDAVAEKKKLAEEILQKVVKGDDFNALASQYSEDTGSKDNGGFYEMNHNGQMVKEFEDWAFTHKAGDTGMVKTEFGFHVMKLDYIYDTLESQRDDIIYKYRVVTYQDTLDAVMSNDEFEIVLKDPYNDF